MDKFVEHTSMDACGVAGDPRYAVPGLTMDYYDGNTVTGLWNYAQHFAHQRQQLLHTFGPSTPGAINLVSGQTHGVISVDPFTGAQTAAPDPYTVKSPNAQGVGTMTEDPDPAFDDCSDGSHAKSYALAAMQGKNIGDLLNEKNVSWGWFQGGFTPQGTKNIQGTDYAQCTTTHTNVAGVSSTDYNPHHQPFQYYASTANPHHLAPASDAEIGHAGQANHQYDITDFNKVVGTDNMPAVSYLKAPNYPGRARLVLGSHRRAELRRHRDQCDPEVEELGLHRDRARLRRLGRLVRPRRGHGDERVERPAARRRLVP